MNRSGAQWWRYDLSICGPHGTTCTREYDPQAALWAASAHITAPVLDNPFTDPAAIGVLHLGLPLETVCADGTRIAITPVIT